MEWVQLAQQFFVELQQNQWYLLLFGYLELQSNWVAALMKN